MEPAHNSPTYWKLPPRIKVFEALGAIADDRVEMAAAQAKVWSSSKNKAYEVTWTSDLRSINANDNGSYWKGYLGYPAIAALLLLGQLPLDLKLANLLKGIPWKDVNQSHDNDYTAVESCVRSRVTQCNAAVNWGALSNYIDSLVDGITAMQLTRTERKRPPAGY